MSNDNENRVLSRVGARQLKQNEIELISAGGGGNTHASLTVTGPASHPDTGTDS